MDETTRPTSDGSEDAPRRDHLRLVADVEEPSTATRGRPRSIGRLIAQTALVADGAVERRRDEARRDAAGRGGRLAGRLLGRVR